MARHWKGPWLPLKEAAKYTGRGTTNFQQLIRSCPTLTVARRRRGPEGEGTPSYVYPVQALDYAMNEEAPR